MLITISIKVSKVNGSIICMPEIFKNIKCDFSDYSISFEYKNNNFIIDIESNSYSEKELEKVFWSFYNYLGFILGYFPNIVEATFVSAEMLANIVEQYKTKECYIRGDWQYILKITEEQFKSSFNEFLKIERDASLQFAMFNLSMMKSNSYPEISIINILQSFDGLFGALYDSKQLKKKIKDDKIKRLSMKLNSLDLDNLNDTDRDTIRGSISIEDINLFDKLYYFCDISKFDVFKYEKDLDNTNKYCFENLVSLFVNTRNKFSHSVNKNKVLNGLESSLYIFKLIILYRILILEKIDLIDTIDKDKFNTFLKRWNQCMYDKLQNDNKDI